MKHLESLPNAQSIQTEINRYKSLIKYPDEYPYSGESKQSKVSRLDNLQMKVNRLVSILAHIKMFKTVPFMEYDNLLDDGHKKLNWIQRWAVRERKIDSIRSKISQLKAAHEEWLKASSYEFKRFQLEQSLISQWTHGTKQSHEHIKQQLLALDDGMIDRKTKMDAEIMRLQLQIRRVIAGTL